jgi:regulator of replication initiation timing
VFGIPLGKGGTAKKETLADECERLRGENAELQTGNDKLRDALGKIAKAAEEAKNA